jgi:hypothetical protein
MPLPCVILVECDLYPTAARGLGRSEEPSRRAVAELGRGFGGPWRAEEKAAALAAWSASAGRRA